MTYRIVRNLCLLFVAFFVLGFLCALFYFKEKNTWEWTLLLGALPLLILLIKQGVDPVRELLKGIEQLRQGLQNDRQSRAKLVKWFGEGFKGHRVDKNLVAQHLKRAQRSKLDNARTILSLASDSLLSQAEEIQIENKKIQLLSESITDSLATLDTGESFIFVNKQFKKVFGGLKEEKKLWQKFRNPKLLEAYQQCIQQAQVVKLKAFGLHNQQQEKYFNISFSPLIGHSSSVHGALLVFHDITELKNIERMRANFVANVSHEVRTPLTNIIGFSQILKEQLHQIKLQEKERLLHAFEKITQNAKRLSGLFEGILELSSIESKGDIQKQIIHLAPLVERVVEDVQMKHSKPMKIEISLEYNRCFAVPILLEQVLTNLIDNAFKYLASDGTIWVRSELDQDQVVLTVEDNGEGIAANDLPRIFERFYRVDASRSQEVEGTGLGLAIVKHIALIHGGRAWVKSELGKGSRFFVSFPQSPKSKSEEIKVDRERT